VIVTGRERAIVGAFASGTTFDSDAVCERTITLGSLVVNVPTSAATPTTSATLATLHHTH
jgi:hypothetical protein